MTGAAQIGRGRPALPSDSEAARQSRARRERHRLAGECIECGALANNETLRCDACRAAMRAYAAEHTTERNGRRDAAAERRAATALDDVAPPSCPDCRADMVAAGPCLWCGATDDDDEGERLELCDFDPKPAVSRWGHLPAAAGAHSFAELTGDPQPAYTLPDRPTRYDSGRRRYGPRYTTIDHDEAAAALDRVDQRERRAALDEQADREREAKHRENMDAMRARARVEIRPANGIPRPGGYGPELWNDPAAKWFYEAVKRELRADPVAVTVNQSHYYKPLDASTPRPLDADNADGRAWLALQAAACVGASRGKVTALWQDRKSVV